MRRSPEIVVLVVLLLIMMAGVLWYVLDRRAKMRAAPPAATQTVTPALKPAPGPAPLARPGGARPTVLTPRGPVEIPDGKTLDFSTGQAVVKDSPEDRAKLAKALKEMEEAAATVTFDPLPVPKKDPPVKVPPDKP
ncbi:MAG: hypothetical protein HY302_15090 [Opitutae bacterium]|nr:hypothetical protein [Opitutae bacterium]